MSVRHTLTVPLSNEASAEIAVHEVGNSRRLWDDLGFPWEPLGKQGVLHLWYSAEREHAGHTLFFGWSPGTIISSKIL